MCSSDLAKDPQGSALFQIYQAFATPAETAAMRQAYTDGIAWGDAKSSLLERIDQDLAPLRDQYHSLVSHPAEIEALLQAGAAKARARATPLLRELRRAVGLRRLAAPSAVTPAQKPTKIAVACFKQYREQDGQFHFKLVSDSGKLLLQSQGFAQARDAALAISALRQQGAAALATLASQLQFADNVHSNEVATALDQLAAAGQ